MQGAALRAAQEGEAAAKAAHEALQASVHKDLRPALAAQAGRLTKAERQAEAAARDAEEAAFAAGAARTERDEALEGLRRVSRGTNSSRLLSSL